MRRDPREPVGAGANFDYYSLPILQAFRSRTAILRLASDEMYAATPSGGTSTACGVPPAHPSSLQARGLSNRLPQLCCL